jgi:hypothetical protein
MTAAQLTNATVGPTKNGRGQAVSLVWSITEGEFEKRLLFQNILIQHDSEDAQRIGRQKFKDVCSSCGITGQVTDLDVLLYKPCLISVVVRVDKDGQYPDKNEVKNILPLPANWTTPPVVATNVAAFRGPRAADVKQAIKDASSTPKAFDAKKEKMDDEIPW